MDKIDILKPSHQRHIYGALALAEAEEQLEKLLEQHKVVGLTLALTVIRGMISDHKRLSSIETIKMLVRAGLDPDNIGVRLEMGPKTAYLVPYEDAPESPQREGDTR